MNRTTFKLAVLLLGVTSALARGPASRALPAAATPSAPASPAASVARASAGSGATPPFQEDLAALLAEHRHPVAGSHGDLSGPGLDFLLREARAAEATVVGEMHGTREIPLLTLRLAEDLRPDGYGAFVIETGPLSTPALVKALRSGIDTYRERVAAYPYTMPFFEWRGEAEMLASILDAGYDVWGIDQEFIGSPRFWLDRLASLAPTDEARSLVAGWKAREMEAAARFRQIGSSDAAFLMQASADDFAALREAFSGSERALEILRELQESARIYRLYAAGDNYASNHRRIEYMKENLARHLRHAAGDPGGQGRAVDGAPRLLVKVGAMHGGRGYSPLNQLDVGNFVAAVADLRGGESLHLYTMAATLRGGDGSISDLASSAAYLGPLLDRLGDGPWTVFDLRPLRPLFHSDANREARPELADLAFRYDVAVLAPELDGARDLVEAPQQ